MALTITHSVVSGAAANPEVDVDGVAWDANHTIAGSIAASEVTSGAELSKTDDTNVTLTLGGTPTTALLKATSITVGWTGTLAASRGGTGLSSLGTGVATALGINVGSAGAFVTFNGALGTPSSGTATNLTGTASGLTAGNVTTNANLTGDVTSVGNATTLATVNSNVGSFGSATAAGTFTVNGKGLITAASSTTVTPAVGSITGLGTGVSDFLATPSSANLATAVTGETGSGALVFGTGPTIDGATVTGVVDAGGATSFEIPNGTGPTVNANGEVAIDTSVSDFSHGVMLYYGGEEMGVVSMPIAEFTTPSNGAVPTYNSTTDEFEMAVPSGSGDVTAAANIADNRLVRGDGGAKGIQESVITVADTTGALSRTGGIAIEGTNTNDSASSGYKGEYIEAVLTSGSAVSLVTTVGKTITSISLTAGDWDVRAIAEFFAANTTVISQFAASVSTTDNTLDTTPGRYSSFFFNAVTSSGNFVLTKEVPCYRFSLSSTTTIYLVGQAQFTTSTCTGFGIISARRIR
jgi:hypothetical protein